MPTPRDEEWRRTDIRPLRLDLVQPFGPQYPVAPALDGLPAELQAAVAAGDARSGLFVQRGPSPALRELDSDLARQGVLLMDLDQLARERPDYFERYFMTEAVRPDEKFAALHGAFTTGGAFLYVPRGVKVDLPVQALYWADSPDHAIFPHTLIVAEPGSEVNVVEQHASAPTSASDGQGFASAVVEIIARQGAKVRYSCLQEWGPSVWSFTTLRALVERDATVETLVGGFGGKLSKNRVDTLLVGPGASGKMLGILFGAERQHFDYHTLQDHAAPNTTSDLLYKCALKDHARSVFSGMIRAHKQAQKTDAVQTNRNLLLSEHCRADSIPNLEILANDLRCTHAAAVAPVDEEQIFYLMSRAIPRPDAVRLIVEGFFEPLLEQIPLPGLRERIRATVERKLAE
jgi:Fe-S cluster assembly protein SufD